MNENPYRFVYGGTVYEIPEYMRGGLERYKTHGIKPGDFLTAVLENNFVEAMGRADDNNLANLPAYGNYLYNHLPAGSWGSPEKVKAWIELKKRQREGRSDTQ